MSTDRRAQLIAAIEAEDWATITALGWTPIFDALKRWWPGAFNATDARAIAEVHGHRNAQTLIDALHRAIDKGTTFRPRASEFGVLIAEGRAATTTRTDKPKSEAPYRTTRALTAVKQLIDSGAPTCNCHPRPADMLITPAGALTCTQCGHLDHGQADDALEHHNAHQDLAA